MERRLILASSSPRRQELLYAMGLDFEVCSPDVDENIVGQPDEVVRLLARKKAEAVYSYRPENVVLAADTIVHISGESLGKPGNRADAARMLRLLSGTWHEVLTGVCMISNGGIQEGTARTKVRFSPLTEEDIRFYCASDEPMGKAGAYAIQGLGGMYVEEISGSYTNVVGLPTVMVRRMLQNIAYPILRRE